MSEFKILSTKEEKKLTPLELKRYYRNYRAYVMGRELTNITPGATTIAPKLKKITNKICEKTIRMFTTKDVEMTCSGLENIPNGPVIFAPTHQNLLDSFIWIPQLDRHVIILHHQDVNKLLLFCQLNTGMVLVKKDDKVNSTNAKLDVINLLLNGHSINWFPEGTYCLSPNKLHLPLKYGIIDVAQKAAVPIIPAAHLYTYKEVNGKNLISKIQSIYGKPIYVTERDDLASKLAEYEESISTLKYTLIEQNGTFKNEDVTVDEYLRNVSEVYKAIELSKVDKEKERRCIFRANEEFYQFFHMNDIPVDENGNFLETDEVRRINDVVNKNELEQLKISLENYSISEDDKQQIIKYKSYKKF